MTSESSICRICLLFTANNQSLDVDAVVTTTNAVLRDMVQMCIPEMDLELTSKPRICTTCSQDIEKFFNFKNSCLETENKVRNYLDSESVQKDIKVDLIDVIQSNGVVIDLNLDFNSTPNDEKGDEMNTEESEESSESNDENSEKMDKIVLNKDDESQNNPTSDVVLFSCNICSYMTTDDAKLKEHKCFPESKRRQIMSMIKCNQCEFRCPTPKILEDHKEEVHMTWYSCKFCAFRTKFINVMTKHKNTAHSSECSSPTNPEHNADCKLCPYRATNQQFLQKHIRAMHYRPPPILTCTMCPYETSDRSNFKKHQYIHTKDKPHKCPECTYQCVSPYQMKKHMKKQHPDIKDGHYYLRKK